MVIDKRHTYIISLIIVKLNRRHQNIYIMKPNSFIRWVRLLFLSPRQKKTHTHTHQNKHINKKKLDHPFNNSSTILLIWYCFFFIFSALKKNRNCFCFFWLTGNSTTTNPLSGQKKHMTQHCFFLLSFISLHNHITSTIIIVYIIYFYCLIPFKFQSFIDYWLIPIWLINWYTFPFSFFSFYFSFHFVSFISKL